MAIKQLNETDILNIMQGAAILASGGGGSVQSGIDLLDAFKQKHPDIAISVKLIPVSDMEVESNGAVVAVMGAPSGALEQPDLSSAVTGAFDELTKIAIRDNRQIDYMLPIEMGGFNTFAPMLISFITGKYLLDADACGRAVPGLETILAAINGADTAPVAMADIDDNRVNLIPADKKDSILVQQMALPVVDLFKQNAGIAGWMLMRQEIIDFIPNGTITTALQIGTLIAELKSQKPANQDYIDELFNAIDTAGIVTAKALHSIPQKIESYSSGQVGGWDIGEFYIGGDGTDPRLHIKFSNENLLVYQQNDDQSWKTIVTAPDIITIYDAKTGEALTNEDLERASIDNTLADLEVMLGVIKVDAKWQINPSVVSSVWAPYLERLGYTDPLIPYPW
jgi:DUF917 family protein